MKSAVRVQLSFMMFLEFFIWGAWFVTLGTFVLKNLHASDTEVGVAFLTQSIGAVIAPFIVGIIADRFVSAQIILGIIHLIGAALLWVMSGQTDFATFYPILLWYMVLYMPTLALVNSISFRQMKDPSKEFSFIRVFGTVGWIIAGLLIGWLKWEKSNTLELTFKMAAIASLLLGLFSFTLPKTPPAKKGTQISVREILGLDAIRMLKNRSYLLFFLASVAICIPLAFYYNFTNPFLNEIGMDAAAGKQSMGQMSEFLFMLVMPLFFSRLGVKKMLALGMLAWVIRYTLFANGNVDSNYWMLIVGILLHGICYDFFFVTGQIYTDKVAGEEFKSSAQGFVTLATYGVGMLIGFLISGPIVNAYKTSATAHDWHSIWLIPAGIAAVVLVLFMLFFKDNNK
ncbi:nucleoside transporter [Chitinophaga terrae (ex Kim and Jung 2007)]|jgi:nucleoside transporter|uniref:Nucleoside transporter n=1 Tax=Chitinophaga terrae (ex Kim and Jung 2007) TaxID=408074 RepID=A0A1H3Y0D2_9BACT|nr:nucleoside permease [Chitinophaga terrae (ex Kim and Jung 2007)]MDQ0108074.1 nucleoside transporter [Chitinophaga terrae (ex Kim and Jung 2007)]GEP89520.1 MFS transporter [Chitinophaga terrae (ex Kim and Jung 2007)]SEA05177.1 nucleoside transporter [Chitinophaga terrae (ex Kim and Jung 2007)]